jgi:hypothetical protein
VPGSYLIDPDRRLILSRGWGIVTEGDLLAHARALKIDPGFVTSFRQIVDLRDVTDLEIDASGIRQIAIESPFGAGACRAIVVRSEVNYGMARMFQMLRAEAADNIQIFRDLSPALSWLGLAQDRSTIEAALAEMPRVALT